MAETGLSSVVIAARSIEVPDGGKFAVRGLSFNDLLTLYQRHGGELGLWFNRFVSGDGAAAGEGMADAIASIIASAPDLAARAIALASGDGSDASTAIAASLPLGVQIAALSAAADLTFTEDMPPKKVLEIVIRMATGLVGPATAPNPGAGPI